MAGTSNPGHLTKQFTSAVLQAFLAELRARGGTPPEEVHQAIHRWLSELTDAAACIPDGGLAGRKIHERCDAVERAYEDWYRSPRSQRTRMLRRLRKRVNALATAYRVRTQLLEEEVDLTIPRSMVEATARLLSIVPDFTGALVDALGRFASRIDRTQ